MIVIHPQAHQPADRTKFAFRQTLRLAGSAVVLISAMASAADRKKQSIRVQSTDPRIATQVLAAGNPVSLPDGSFIASVNGRQKNIVLKPGDTVRVRGKGFDQRRPKSVVGLFLPGTTTGALLDIVSWTDAEIMARVPVGNANLATASDNARLKVVPIRVNGLMLDMTVGGIRFQLPPIAMRTVTLIGIPDRMIRLAQQPGWTTERQPKAAPGEIGPGPGAAVYVKRTKGAANANECATFNDVIDLTDIYHNNYRVKSFRWEFFPDRPGFVRATATTGPRRLGARGEDINGNKLQNDSSPANFAKIFSSNYPVIYQVGNLYVCDAGYRLHLTVEGPANIDPISGNKISSSVVN